MRPTLVLFSLFLTSTLFAGTADLKVTLTGAPTAPVHPGDTVTWTASVENLGPDAAHRISFDTRLFTTPGCLSEIIPVLDPGASRTVQCSAPALGGYRQQISVSASSESDRDPNTNNNYAWVDFDLLTPPDLYVSVYAAPLVDPGLPVAFAIDASNMARTTATGVVIDIESTLPITNVSEGCTANGTTARCEVGTLTPWADPNKSELRQFTVEVTAPDRSHDSVTVKAQIHGNEADNDLRSNESTRTATTYETYTVANTNDSGSGSLRAAIEAANAGCLDALLSCKIAFRIPPNGAQWLTIRPAAPLPAIRSNVIVDGNTQARYFGDTNAAGPEIEINGESVSGDGLVLDEVCSGSVRALAINGFSGNGLRIATNGCDGNNFRNVDGCYIGTNPTGTTAVPNGRGIWIESRRWPVWVNHNVVSGNTRSGIVVAIGPSTSISQNVIGLNAAKTGPLGNGASGVYVAPGGSTTDVSYNVIGFNHDSGISIDRNAVMVSVGFNSIQANWQLGIDYGLDGPTSVVPVMAEHPSGFIHAPEITSAIYDAASDTTIITGRAVLERTPGSFGAFPTVDIYANDAVKANGYAEGQYVLGRAHTSETDGAFEFRYAGRVPGPWITATATTYNVWGLLTTEPDAGGGGYATTTSEFGKALRVSE